MAAKVKPIPEGFHTVTPHLVVRGADKAIDFYKRAFGATELGRHLGPDGKSIMHARIQIGDSFLFVVDEVPEWGNRSPQALGGTPVTIHLYVDNVDALFKRAVGAGAKVQMPLADQFWGDRYGMLLDPFGHSWSLGTHKEDLSEAEMAKRAAAAMAQMGKGKP